MAITDSEPTSVAGIGYEELKTVRRRVQEHLDANRTVSELAIEPFAPAPGTPFAFVAPLPKLTGTARYRCSYCETGDKFKDDGRIVLGGDHLLRTIGPDCWKKHWDEHDIAIADQDYTEFRRAERFRRLRNRLGPLARRLLSEFNRELPSAGSMLAFVDAFPNRFRNWMPDLAAALADAVATAEGHLVVERLVRRFGDLEGRRGQRMTGDGDLETTWMPDIVHTIAGAEALIASENVGDVLKRARKLLGDACTLMDNTDWEVIGDRAFLQRADRFEAGCRDAVALFEAAGRRIRKVELFLSPKNIAGISRWANDPEVWVSLSGRCELADKGLRWVPAGGARAEDEPTPVVIRMPPGALGLPGLGPFRQALAQA